MTSLERAAAGDDCAESMFLRKVEERAAIQGILDAQNITYWPIVWSSFGRMHAAAAGVLACIAKRIARRHGLADYRAIFAKIMQAIGVELARRSARMSLACRRQGVR